MSGLFISYAHVDHELAIALAESLEQAGYSVFRDADPSHGIPAGTRWMDELFKNLERSDIVVFLASDASLRSPWCHTELAVAIARQLHVVQVSLVAVGIHPLLSEVQVLPAARSISDLVGQLLNALGRTGFGPSERAGWDLNKSPFPGLHRLTADYAQVFFGRDAEIGEIMGRLFGPRPAPILVVGASGSGKSSLLQAGVLARLERRKGLLVLPPVEPWQNPVGRFVLALQAADPTVDADRIAADPHGIAKIVDRLTAHGERVIACIDQAEDLLTNPDPQRTTDLLDQLRNVDRDRLTLLVALRSASLDAWGRDRRFAELSPANPVWVRPLDRTGLRDVIRKPARQAGISFDPPELVEQIVDDTRDGRALPLLAALLEELTEGHTRTNPVTVDQALYDAVGPVERVVESRADDALTEARTTLGMTNKQIIHDFLRLVDLDEDGNVVRMELEVDQLPPNLRELFDVFEDHRLVIRDTRLPAADGRKHVEAVEVVAAVHEVVFTAWPALADAVRDQQTDLQLRSRLRREARQWEDAGEGTVSLTGGRLDRAVEWRQRHPDDVSPTMRRYLDAATRQRRRRRSLTIATPILATVAAVVTVFAILLFRQVGVATDARRTTDALRLVGEAESAERTRPDLSVLLALEAAARGGDPRALNAPFVALTRGAGPRRYQQLPARLADGAFSAGGARAIVTDTRGVTIDWDAVGGREVLRSESLASSTAISSDGSTVAVADTSLVGVRSFGSEAWGSRCPIAAGETFLRLNRTGQVLATISSTSSTTVSIRATTGCVSTSRLRFAGKAIYAAIDADSNRLAVLMNGYDDLRVKVIDLEKGIVVNDLLADADVPNMTSVAIAQDEVATLDTDGILRVWRLPSSAVFWQGRAFAPEVAGAALAPLPRSPQAANSSSPRWLAAGRNGGLTVLATGDDRPGEELASLPALGDVTDPGPLALGTGNGTANIVDQTGRITSWSFDTATAFDAPLLADKRIDHVAALSGGGFVATGPDGAWIANGAITALPAGAKNGIPIARGRTWAVTSASGQILLGSDSQPPRVIGSVDTEPVAIAFLDSRPDSSPAIVVTEQNGRTTVFGDGEPHTLITGTQLGSTVVTGTAGFGHLYLALANGQLAVVDAGGTSDAVVRTYGAHGNGPTSAVALSPDGKLLATGGDDRRIVLWNLANGNPRPRPALVGHNEKIISLAFDPTGTELASAAEDGNVLRWSIQQSERIGEAVQLPTKPSVIYAPGNDSALFVASSGVTRWPLSPTQWQDTACRLLAGRTFTETERRQILGSTVPMVHCPSR